MEKWIQIEEALDALLLESSLIKDETELAKAKSAYEKGIDGRAEGLFFTDYLLFDYKADDKSLFDQAAQEARYPGIDQTLLHRFSVFEVVQYPNSLGLKDIFTKEDFKVVNGETLMVADLMVGRLLISGSEAFLLENALVFPNSYKEALIKGMMEKYNDFVISGKQRSLDEFLKTQPEVLMKYIEILNEVEEETFDSEDDFLVYQSIFLVGDPVALKHQIMKEPGFETSLDESGFMVVKLYADEAGDFTGEPEDLLIAEIVIDGNRVEIECLDELRLNMAKEKMKQCFGDAIAHFKDEVVSMDDLINGILDNIQE